MSASTWNRARAARVALAPAAVAAALLVALPPALAGDEEGCLGCHGLAGFAIREAGNVRALGVSGEVFGRSMHADLGCRECHAEIASIPHGESKDVSCGQPCHGRTSGGKSYSHEGLYWEFTASSHGGVGAARVSCLVCHPAPESREGAAGRDKLAEARRCAACHPKSAKVQAWFRDRHFAALSGGNGGAPSCPDCHSTHRVHPASAVESTVNPAHLADTCSSGALGGERRGGCHGALSPSAVAGASMNQLAGGGRRGVLPAVLTLLAGALCVGLAARAAIGLARGR